MTRDEAKKIIMFIAGSYPNFKPLDLSETVDAWSTVFCDVDVEQVKLLVKSYVMSDTSGFAPSINSIIQILNKMKFQQELNEMEAWSLVSKALKNGYYHAEEEFAKLPPLVQKAVGQPSNLRNWAVTDMESIENVVQSNFMRSYRQEVKRAEEIQKMPSEVRKLIEKVNEGRGIEVKPYVAIEEKRKEWSGVPMPEHLKEKMKEFTE